MALTGKFIADFSSFQDACAKAEVSVEKIGTTASQVGPKLNRLVEQFSGKKIVAEAALVTRAVEEIGGVSELTAAEVKRVGATMAEAMEKLQKTGQPIPANMKALADATKDANKSTTDWLGTLSKMAGAVGIAFSAQAVIGFVGSVFDAAGAVKDLSNEWGVSTKAVQTWSSAAKLSGSSAEDLGKSIGFMTRELGEGSKTYQASIEAVGLSFKDLRAMSPEDAFRTLVDTVGKIHDPMAQAEAAVKLFGKSAMSLLPAIREEFLKVAEGQAHMSDDTINRLEAAGDAWEELKNRVVIYTGEIIGKTMEGVPVITASWSNFFTSTKILFTEGKAAQEAWVAAQVAAQKAADGTSGTVQTAAQKHAAYQAALRTTQQVLDEQKKVEDAAREALSKRKAELEATKRAQESYASSLRSMTDDVSGGAALDKANKWLIVLKDTVPIQQMTRARQDELNKTMGDAIEVYRLFGEQAPQAILDVYTATLKTVPEIKDLAAALALLPQNVQGIALSSQQTVSAMGGLATGLKGVAQKMPLIGGDLVGDLGKNVLGAVMGGGSVLKTIGSTIGMTMFDPEKSGIGKALTGLTDKLPGMLGKIGSMVPVIGSLIGPGIELAVKGLNKLFGKNEESQQVNPMRDKFIAAAGGIDALNKQAVAAGTSLDALLHAKKVTDFEAAVKGLQSSFEFQNTSIQQAMETAQKYGFTLEELGPALQRQQLDAQAQQLYKDWQVLNAAGLDTVAITTRMGESVNAYLQQALAMGTEVPQAMKPMLESMAKAGQLTDANGNKIEDLEAAGVSFSMSMSEGFKTLIESVSKLTDAISRGLGVAVDTTSKKIDAMPKTVDVAVVYHDPGFQTSQPVEMESYAKGSEGFRNFGKGTPVMLHGWEAVVPRDQVSQDGPPLLAATGGGGEPGTVINISIDAAGAFFETPGDLQRLADRVNEALTAKFGLTHRMRAA